MRRFIAVIALTVVSLVSANVRDAAAQQRAGATEFLPASTAVLASTVPATMSPELRRQILQYRPAPRENSAALVSLYASTALLQVLDVHSTISASRVGATEANPLMAGVVGNRRAFIATKAAVAVGTIFAARQMAKKNKMAAVLTLVGINSVYAMVVNHNYKIARGR